MSRLPTVTVPIRKVRARPRGFRHRVLGAVLRAARGAFARLARALSAAGSIATAACARLDALDPDRRWKVEQYGECERAYEEYVRGSPAFVERHRGRWAIVTFDGDVHVFRSLEEAGWHDVEGAMHVVGDRWQTSARPMIG